MADYCIVNVSPRLKSRCSSIVERLLLALDDATVDQIDVGIAPVNPCTACDNCEKTFRCTIRDEMEEYRKKLDEASALIIVTPVYFAGPPSQLKAFLDRLQPYYWDKERKKQAKRPAYLFVVREGGDPHGYEPLMTIARSALAVAGFKVEESFDFIGLYNDALEETADAGIEKIKAS